MKLVYSDNWKTIKLFTMYRAQVEIGVMFIILQINIFVAQLRRKFYLKTRTDYRIML